MVNSGQLFKMATIEQKESKRIEIEVIERKGCNITFILSVNNIFSVFRIHFEDKSRANARHPDIRATDIYFEGFEGMEKSNFMLTYKAEYIVDLCLFAERKKDWLLYKILEEEKNK